MGAELQRSMKELKLPNYDPPYYIGYQVTDHETNALDAHYGALFADDHRTERRLFADVRVGSYLLDNSNVDPMADIDLGAPDPGYSARREGPLDSNPEALRAALWLLTDERYKAGLSTYMKKRARAVNAIDNGDAVPSFSQEKPSVSVEKVEALAFDHERWKAEALKLSEIFKGQPSLFDSDVKIDAEHTTRYFVSSEGARVVTQNTVYAVHLDAVARAPDGQLLEDTRDIYAPTEAQTPSASELAKQASQIVDELGQLQRAPVIDPYTGPALLAPEATGVLFHEAVGHRLEGDRQDDDTEGRTFKGQVGNGVLPPFLSVIDDPTLANVGAVPLNGKYRFDEQGTPAERTVLVDKGVLRNYLLSRHLVKGFTHSNGHGRSASGRAPAARMSNLLVVSDAAHQKTWAALKADLIAEAKKQGKPYGLIIKDMNGGDTNTSSSGYQAFRGQPRLVYRVDVKDGHEELVRGVEMVGTPLTVINKITEMGDQVGIFNGYCGAESGFVPVSTVAPAALIEEIELQRTTKTNQRPPLLPNPWSGK